MRGAPLLLVPVGGCTKCGDARADGLYALAAGPYRRLCSRCWEATGRPWPGPADVQQQHESELKVREAMQKRGGTDRHMVRNGRT